MGVDCPDIKRIIHWSSPCTIEEYVQETSRGGRDGASAVAILYKQKGNKGLTAPMKQYLENACLEKQAAVSTFSEIYRWYCDISRLQECKCCDICRKCCTCYDNYYRITTM